MCNRVVDAQGATNCLCSYFSGVRAQTLSLPISNSLNLQVEPTIAGVGAFLISA
jgi:hypothetical protein